MQESSTERTTVASPCLGDRHIVLADASDPADADRESRISSAVGSVS
jgi:hypothetical protein